MASVLADAQLVAVERQPPLLELLHKNIEHHGWNDRFEVVGGDLRERALLQPHSCDLVLANPPYTPADAGQRSSDVIRREAHSEQHGTLADFVAAAAYMAKPTGLFRFVVPPKRLVDAFESIATTDFGVRSLQFVHATLEHDAHLVKVTAKRGARHEVQTLPPLLTRS